ncbi:hypothetical protein BJY00DRAFT_317399 [Aspergillus carlsbadensis]|nr:hypothetical protein BJY00DRAFT_317399 [Aspergillus carlsbadensis]
MKPTRKQRTPDADDANALLYRRRPRGSIACEECSRRKVRCDIELALLPCTNCKLDNATCRFNPGKRVAGLRQRKISKILGGSQGGPGQQPPRRSSAMLERMSHANIMGVDHSTAPATRPRSILSFSDVLLDPAEVCYSASQSHPGSDTHHPHLTFPSYIAAPPGELDSADIAYLRVQGAFETPVGPFQKALLACYLEHVHDFLPILDIHEFLRDVLSVGREDPRPAGVSLFLYQAMMFASVGCVSAAQLRQAGFESRIAAREAFARKVTALYKVGYERNPVALAQGLMLVAYWRDSASTPKPFSHWAEVAWSLMQGMVANSTFEPPSDAGAQSHLPYRVYSGRTNISPHLMRRMYWFCFMIGRTVSLASRHAESSVWRVGVYATPLELGDFDITPVAEATLLGLELDPDRRSIAHQKRIAQLHVAAIELCVRIAGAVDSQPGVLAPQDSDAALHTYLGLDIELGGLFQWLTSFTRTPAYDISSALASTERILILRQSIPLLLFHAAVASLLSQQVVLHEGALRGLLLPDQVARLQDRRFIATASVTGLFVHLQRHNKIQHLPPCVMALLLPASVTQLTRWQAEPDPLFKTLNNQYLDQSLEILAEMGQVSSCAQRWRGVLVGLLERAKSRVNG